jgi:DNA-binding IclR family transcriptional regulator
MPPASRKPSRRRPTYSAPALKKGLEIIELLAASQQPLSTRAIAERLGRSKSEIFRMVFVLVERGYLARDPSSDALTLTNRLFDLGIRAPRSRQLMEVAAPAMERLSDKIGQSAHLVVVNRGYTVVIATIAGNADVSFVLRLGYRRSALDANSGHTIIAFQDAARRMRMVEESMALSRPSMDWAELTRHLDAIVKRGHLISKSHDVVGVTDICAPVLGPHGRAVASIVIPYLDRHGAAPQHDNVLAALLETCRAIAEELK